MAAVPPKPISLHSGAHECQEALADLLVAIADEAHAKGWSREEIVVAIQEVANAWYLGELKPARTEDAGSLARRLVPGR